MSTTTNHIVNETVKRRILTALHNMVKTGGAVTASPIAGKTMIVASNAHTMSADQKYLDVTFQLPVMEDTRAIMESRMMENEQFVHLCVIVSRADYDKFYAGAE